MAEVWRGITFEAWRYVYQYGDAAPFLTSEQYQCQFRAEGALLRSAGHLKALDCLQETVVRWVTQNWANAVLLPESDADLQVRARRELPRLNQAIVPTACDLGPLAAFLLEVVCEKQLRERGLLVTDVKVSRAGEPEPGIAQVSEVTRDTYLAEQPGAV